MLETKIIYPNYQGPTLELFEIFKIDNSTGKEYGISHELSKGYAIMPSNFDFKFQVDVDCMRGIYVDGSLVQKPSNKGPWYRTALIDEPENKYISEIRIEKDYNGDGYNLRLVGSDIPPKPVALDFSEIDNIFVPEDEVQEISIGGQVVWTRKPDGITIEIVNDCRYFDQGYLSDVSQYDGSKYNYYRTSGTYVTYVFDRAINFKGYAGRAVGQINSVKVYYNGTLIKTESGSEGMYGNSPWRWNTQQLTSSQPFSRIRFTPNERDEVSDYAKIEIFS